MIHIPELPLPLEQNTIHGILQKKTLFVTFFLMAITSTNPTKYNYFMWQNINFWYKCKLKHHYKPYYRIYTSLKNNYKTHWAIMSVEYRCTYTSIIEVPVYVYLSIIRQYNPDDSIQLAIVHLVTVWLWHNLLWSSVI